MPVLNIANNTQNNSAKMVTYKDREPAATLEIAGAFVLGLSEETGGPKSLPKGYVSVWYDEDENSIVKSSELAKVFRDLASYLDKNF